MPALGAPLVEGVPLREAVRLAEAEAAGECVCVREGGFEPLDAYEGLPLFDALADADAERELLPLPLAAPLGEGEAL
jgi:hypothetical protein